MTAEVTRRGRGGDSGPCPTPPSDPDGASRARPATSRKDRRGGDRGARFGGGGGLTAAAALATLLMAATSASLL